MPYNDILPTIMFHCPGGMAMCEQTFMWKPAAPAANNRIQVARRFEASSERVFDAWVDPKLAHRWLFASPASVESDFELDLRVGGRWKIAEGGSRTEYAALGEYLTIERPHRLVFTFAMPQFSPDHDRVIV